MSSDHYKQKYLKKASEFWNLQEIPKTKEEEEFENLIHQLESMLEQHKAEVHNLEVENEEKQRQIGDVTSVIIEYEKLKREQINLSQLQKDIERYNTK